MKPQKSQAAVPALPKGVTAIHCFNGTAVTPAEHKKLIDGPIAIAKDAVEEARKRVDVIQTKGPHLE